MHIQTLIKRLFGIQGFSLKDLKIYQDKIVVVLDRDRLEGEYDRRWCTVRDCDWGHKKIFIQFPKIRYLAPNGIVRNEQLPWVSHYGRLTRRFEYFIALLCQIASPFQVSHFLELDKMTVYEIEHKHLAQGLNHLTLPENLEEISIDEVSWRKGQRYFTIVTDLKSHKVIWVALGRTSQAIDSFFYALGLQRCAHIKTVAIDMWDAYEGSVKRFCPNVTLVYDRFHVIKMLNEAINGVRKEEFEKAKGTGKRLLTNSKWILLKQEKKLSGAERKHLDRLCDINENIQKAVLFKELFTQTYLFNKPPEAEQHLIDCIVTAYKSGLSPLQEFADAMSRRKQGIINWYFKKRSTSVSEGINNVVKTLRRVAYGYRNPNYFRLKILQKCGFLTIQPLVFSH